MAIYLALVKGLGDSNCFFLINSMKRTKSNCYLGNSPKMFLLYTISPIRNSVIEVIPEKIYLFLYIKKGHIS